MRAVMLSLREADEAARFSLGTALAMTLDEMAVRLRADDGEAALKDYEGSVFWALLAASLRLRPAHRRLARIFALAEPMLGDLWDDAVTESGGVVLADTYDGDPAALRELIAAAGASPYGRSEAATAARILVERGEMPRATALSLFEAGVEAAYVEAGHTMACNMMDEAALEGVQAFNEKRSPRWSR